MAPVTLFLIICSTFQVAWAETDHTEARVFVAKAVATELSDMGLSKQTRDLLLATDKDGHPLSFIPDCPICLGVQDALGKVDVEEQDRQVPDAWTVPKASTRTSSLARFVKGAVKEQLDGIEDVEQRLDMAQKLRLGSKEGQRQLARYQSRKVGAYKMMWSCLMCDAADKAGD